MRTLWYRLPLALKIALPMALLSLLSALTIVGVTQYSQQRLLHERTDKLGAALVSRLAATTARPLMQNDAVSLQATLAGFAEEPVVQRAVIFNLQQQLIAAAGDEAPDAWDYSATIHWQDGAIGRAVLSLRPITVRGYYPQLGDLLVLTAILTAISAAIGVLFGSRAETLLVNLTRKLSGEQIDLNYAGTDALARVLDTPPPPLLTPEPAPAHYGEFVLHVVTASAAPTVCSAALTLVEAASKVYNGRVHITRAGGITAIFHADDDLESPFRALCCAELIAALGSEAGYRLALAVLPSSDAGNIWQEQQLIERLHRTAQDAAADCRIQIDGQLQRHTTIKERCKLVEANDNFWQVTALESPYDVLLERQMHTLRSELMVSH
jgi:hypothetical protein